MCASLILIGIIRILFSLVPPSTEADADKLYHLGIFLIVFVYAFIVYLEFIIKSIKLFRCIEKTDKIYRNAILSLVIMVYCVISAMLMFVFDRVFFTEPYSIFYYLADVSILIGIVFAYFGYVKEKSLWKFFPSFFSDKSLIKISAIRINATENCVLYDPMLEIEKGFRNNVLIFI